MRKRSYKKSFLMFAIMLAVFIIFTLLIKTIDVRAIGPEKSKVGFASLNDYFHNLFDYNKTFYKISKYLGYMSFLIIGLYGLVGLFQWIKRKCLAKVNKNVLILGAFYALVLVVYVLFEKIVINYRPVLEDGVLEASYPSSHTILAICVCASSIIASPRIFKKNVKIFNILTGALLVGIVLTRLFSGVHWFTDIIGGILISMSLCYLFMGAVEYNKEKELLK